LAEATVCVRAKTVASANGYEEENRPLTPHRSPR